MLDTERAGYPAAWSMVLAAFLLVAASADAQQSEGRFSGSVPVGEATATPVELSLKSALDGALKYNLGVIESSQNTRSAQAERLRRLNALLPQLSARLNGSIEQINLKALGFNLNIPGVSVPTVVGPFSVIDARAYLSQQIFNLSDLRNWRAAAESEKASTLAYKRDRDLVVLTAGSAYLMVISDTATTESIRARVGTAQTLYQNDVDLNRQGVIASLDVLRAQVELQTEQQRLISAENQRAIDELMLGRIVGLPSGQKFHLADAIPYAPLNDIDLDGSLKQARLARADYQSAEALLRAAQLSSKAVAAENYPSLTSDVNYGDIGSPNLDTSHATFSAAVGLNVPIFQGSRVRADKLAADTALERRKAELAELGARIDDEVRIAFLNLQSSSQLVAVAESNLELASRALTQAQDRNRSGVADNLEVVQAQESVAAANQSDIASLYAFNIAKLSLALALGVAEQSAAQYLGVK